MNSKELFNSVLNFKPCKRTLNWELCYWGGTINNWNNQGLLKVINFYKNFRIGEQINGPASPFSFENTCNEEKLLSSDISKYFGFDEGFYPLPYNYWCYPMFDEKIIYEDERYVEKIDKKFGVRVRELRQGGSMPTWLEFPLKSRRDWEELKEQRLRPDSIKERYRVAVKDYLNDPKAISSPKGIFSEAPCGFFGSLRFLFGEEKLFTLYYDDPKLIHDINSHLCNLWIQIAEELTSQIEFDYACFWEDMAGKNGSLISPTTFKEFMSPYYTKLINYLKSKSIKIFIVDTDGKVDKLIPLFLECGVNTMFPLERQADNDLISYRKTYPKLAMMGGFDKNTLYKGTNAIDKELEQTEWLINQGGYIPFADHSIPPNSTWENFKYYREKLKKIIDLTAVL